MAQFTPYLVAWAVLALIVIGLAVYRWLIGMHEDDSIHIQDAEVMRQQGALGHKIEAVDRWGKALTLAVLVSGVILAGLYLNAIWIGQYVDGADAAVLR